MFINHCKIQYSVKKVTTNFCPLNFWTKTGGQKSHFLRSRSLPRPALLSCPLVPFDVWLSATRCARSRACHTPSPRRSRTTAADLSAGTPRCRRSHHGARVGGILSIRGPEVSRETPRVGTRRGQSPTPHARALPSVDTCEDRCSAAHRSAP